MTATGQWERVHVLEDGGLGLPPRWNVLPLVEFCLKKLEKGWTGA